MLMPYLMDLGPMKWRWDFKSGVLTLTSAFFPKYCGKWWSLKKKTKTNEMVISKRDQQMVTLESWAK